MKKTMFLLTGLITTVIGTAYATGENTVTSKSYVDAQDALKQDKITAGTTGNVVTYNGEDANCQEQFNERGIYSGSATYTNNDADKLVTASVVKGMADTLESMTITDNRLEGIDTNGTTINCQFNNSCTLWRITSGTTSLASAGTFAPLTAPACLAYGETASNETECCSGVRYSSIGMRCGCTSDDDCSGSTPVCNTETHKCNRSEL